MKAPMTLRKPDNKEIRIHPPVPETLKRVTDPYTEDFEDTVEALLKQQNYRCAGCGRVSERKGGSAKITAHHNLWRGAVGTHHIDNQTGYCNLCHNGILHESGCNSRAPAYVVPEWFTRLIRPDIVMEHPDFKAIVIPFREFHMTVHPELHDYFDPIFGATEYEAAMNDVDRKAFRKDFNAGRIGIYRVQFG